MIQITHQLPLSLCFFKGLFYSLRVRVHVCVWYAHTSAVPMGQERAPDSLEVELQVLVRHLVWVLGARLGPLQEQQALTAAGPPVQPQLSSFLMGHLSIKSRVAAFTLLSSHSPLCGPGFLLYVIMLFA